MFLNKWTVQIARPGQLEEIPFDTEDQAIEYIRQEFSSASGKNLGGVLLIDPEQRQRTLNNDDVLSVR
jgi:hypothetical protein